MASGALLKSVTKSDNLREAYLGLSSLFNISTLLNCKKLEYCGKRMFFSEGSFICFHFRQCGSIGAGIGRDKTQNLLFFFIYSSLLKTSHFH